MKGKTALSREPHYLGIGIEMANGEWRLRRGRDRSMREETLNLYLIVRADPDGAALAAWAIPAHVLVAVYSMALWGDRGIMDRARSRASPHLDKPIFLHSLSPFTQPCPPASLPVR